MGNVTGSEVYKLRLRLRRTSGQSHLAMRRRKELLASWLGGLLLQERNLVSPFWLKGSSSTQKGTEKHNLGMQG